jgi:hypothetical protein
MARLALSSGIDSIFPMGTSVLARYSRGRGGESAGGFQREG